MGLGGVWRGGRGGRGRSPCLFLLIGIAGLRVVGFRDSGICGFLSGVGGYVWLQ